MNFIKNHKLLVIIIVLILGGSSYYAYTKLSVQSTETRYILETVQKETLLSSVSGSGQVALLDQLDISPTITGDLSSLKVKAGQEVAKGDLIAQLSCSDLNKQLRDARISLESAKISMAKTTQGATADELKSANNKITTAQRTLTDAKSSLLDVKSKAVTDLANEYEDAITTLEDAHDKALDIVTRQINSMYINPQNEDAEINFVTSDSQLSSTASWKRAASISALNDFANLINTLDTNQAKIDAALISADNYLATVIDFLNDLGRAVEDGVITLDTNESTLNSYASTVNSAKTSINTSVNSIKTQKRDIATQITNNKNNITTAENKVISAEESLTDAKDSLATLQAAPDALDVKSQKISLQQKQNSVSDILEDFEECSIEAPFDGVVSEINYEIGESVPSGEVLAILITKQKVAEISLNEVDVAKVKVGQKATLTFDAIEDLSISGLVASVDTLGTTNQGVVNYGVKISFDAQDNRIKPGMTASASIITEVHSDVLTVSSGAVKQNTDDESYVEIIDNPISSTDGSQGVKSETAPRQQIVTTGISNDTSIEIISGLKESDQVVTRTVSATADSSPAKTSNSSAGAMGGLGGMIGGGGPRD